MTFEELFALEPGAEGVWIAPRPPQTDEARLFGGLLLGHALTAACAAEAGRCHALHAHFVGAGSKAAPLDVAVERTRDGRRYAARSLQLRQQDRLLLIATTSHHGGDDGPEHQADMPDVPPPEALEDQQRVRHERAAALGRPRRSYLAEVMLDARAVEMPIAREHGIEGRRAVWFRPRQPIRGGEALHQAAVAFASDLGLVHVGLQVHNVLGDRGALQATSLNHAIWFHREAAGDDWLLQVQRCPVAAHGRGLSHASIFTRDGRLVASAAQEFLARRLPAGRTQDEGE